MIKISIFILVIFNSFLSISQKKLVEELPHKLKEISGLAFLNDTVLIAHNDSGNEAEIYFLDLLGNKIHTVVIENAENKDWEDITVDQKGYIYIADIGNNNNTRKDLCIYKVNSKNILEKETVKAEKIAFNYPEQIAFPPEEKDLHFDSEGIAFYKDSLYLFTKCRAEPFDGKTFCYTIPTKPGTYKAEKQFEYVLGKGGWWKDAITGAEIKNDKCYLLTYDRLIIFSFTHKKLEFLRQIGLGKISQKEAVAVNSTGQIYIADERHKVLGGGNLYRVKIPKK
jgi:hypothetical protein